MTDDLDKPYFTKNNLNERFASIENDFVMFSGYMMAIDVILPRFLKIVEAAENFDDLKKQVLDYTNEHIAFRDHIEYLRHDDDALWEDVQTLPPELRP